MGGGAWWAAVRGVMKSQTRLSDFTFTFHFHALEKEMATHSSTLAWKIPWTEEPGRLQSMGSWRVRHDWATSLHLRQFYLQFFKESPHMDYCWPGTSVHGDYPGKNTGVSCHCLLQCMKVKSQSEVAHLCLTLHDPMDCSLPVSSIHGIFQARVLEWGAIDSAAMNIGIHVSFSIMVFTGYMPSSGICWVLW